MIRRLLLPFVASLLVITITTTTTQAQFVARPPLLGPAATQPAAAPEPTSPDQATALASAPASQVTRSRSGIPLETLTRLLNQRLQQAQSAEATVSPSGFEPDQPMRLREGLVEYENAKAQGDAAEIAKKRTQIQSEVAQSKTDVAALRACQEHYSKAKTILDRDPEISNATVRQYVSRKVLELQKLIRPLHNAVAYVDGALTQERYRQRARDTFRELQPYIIDDAPSSYGIDYYPYYSPDFLRRPYTIGR